MSVLTEGRVTVRGQYRSQVEIQPLPQGLIAVRSQPSRSRAVLSRDEARDLAVALLAMADVPQPPPMR